MGLTRPTARQINTVISTISDPLTVLNEGAISANVDIGLIMDRGNADNVAVVWQESTDQFIFATTTSTGATNANITVDSYANIQAGNITAVHYIGDGSLLTGITTTYSNVQVGQYLPTYSGAISSSALTVTGNIDVSGNLITTAGTFNLLNATATTINAFGAATTLTIGADTGITTINNNLTVGASGKTLTINGNIVLNGTYTNTYLTTYGSLFLDGTSTNQIVQASSNSLTNGGGFWSTGGTPRVYSTTGIDFRTGVTVRTQDTPTGGVTKVHITAAGVLELDSDIVASTTSANVFNATSTTVNAFGAATTLIVGATTGVANIRNATTNIIGNATVGGTLNITGNVIQGTVPVLTSSSVTTGIGTTATALDTFATASYRSAKYVISINDITNTQFQTCEIILVQDGTTATISTYGSVWSGTSDRMNFTASIATGTLTLYGAGISANNTVKLVRTLIPV